ncbi:metal ABC transporter permease [Alkaliphilus transvaalensis]|uniref:metal ABC transporter permease n=1 Tax=Alkaliphilus transvaalensis TaxID=114628 RepID=UPI000550DF46|nr:metal ABC transporter permease [Alkaliphilus transvaalensis]
MINFFSSLLGDHTLKTVMIGATFLGVTSGSIGTFAVLRKQSLLGDAISHSALPGIALAFLLTGSRAPIILLTGGLLVGWISALCMMVIVKYSSIKYDGALGIILSVFFGIGMVLMSFIQRLPTASQAGLNKFLFGRAATLLQEDLVVMGWFGGIALLLMLIFWKEIKLLCFNPEFGSSLGFSMLALDLLVTTLLVVAIVVGLQTVGVVLMSVMIIAPGVAARQWTNRLEIMVILAGVFGAFSGIIGAIISSEVRRMPTGPIIVLVSFLLVVLSILFAPNRGLIYNLYRKNAIHKKIREDQILIYCYHFYQEGLEGVSGEKLLNRLNFLSNRRRIKLLNRLIKDGLLSFGSKGWHLTPKGINRVLSLK